MKRVADYVIEKIAELNIEHIFMVTGRGILPLTDAVAKLDTIKGISMYHEQSAAYATMSYAKVKNSLGACLVSTGCAATNAITGTLCAYQDNLPIIFISGQHMLDETTYYTKLPIRTYGSQETNIISIVKPITKYATMIIDANEIAYELEKAVYIALNGRQGPVWIDIPLDIQSRKIDEKKLRHFILPDKLDFKIDVQIVTDLKKAKRPLILIGGGTRKAKKEIYAIAEKWQIPVVYTPTACDIYGSGNTYSIGAIGAIGAPRAGNFVIQNADYILIIGSKVCSQSIGVSPEKIAREAKIVVIDIDQNEHIKKGIRIDKFINADARQFLRWLKNQDLKKCPKEWLDKCLHWKKYFNIKNETFIVPDEKNHIDLYYLANEITSYLNENTAIITDAGLEELIIPTTIQYKGNQRCLFPASQGAMGYAIPAIFGTYYASYDDIVVIVGDGSIMMNIQELQLLNYFKISPKIIIINNNMYAIIRSRQKDLFKKRTIGNDPSDGVPQPNFSKIAASFGINYYCISQSNELATGLTHLFKENGPIICEIMCKSNQKYFHTSFKKGKNNKMVRPSLEDLSPFLNREVLKNEMLINPIDL